ncbi:MAG: glycoside hydrolase family 3 C-terminal domain-containing protein [Bacilli bacterium]|nr:glycoside hydrolase family 3 C-terminal domain-containing protein [Bacilli bacterium]
MGNFFAKNKVRLIVSGAALLAMIAVGVGLGIGNDLAFNRYSAVISHHLAPNGEPHSAEAEAARNMGNQLARDIEREGIVLLRNEDSTLPLSKSINRVNVFGHGSVDWYIMSSGSEMVGTDGQTSYDLNSALEHYGIEVNQELPTYYKKWKSPVGVENTIFQCLGAYQIREPSLETEAEYQQIYDNARGYSDTAFMVISRYAGENSDCPHYQVKTNGQARDDERTYLQISKEEQDTLTKLGEDFENVIVVINSTNAMQLDFLEDIPGIDACISVGATGVQGALSIPEIIWGDASPSGHLTDTYPYNHEYNITYYRGNTKFTHQYIGGKAQECRTMGTAGGDFYQTSCYVEYNEGIYVGYRWFETADAEGFWDDYGGYDNVVQFPFGFGMSYTTFDWTLTDVDIAPGSNITNEDKINLTVNVKNAGPVSGKDVIEVFLTAPYYDGGIEKSSVKLVAYAKTPELKPLQEANVEIEVDCKEFKSYDCYDDNGNDFCGYEMEHGTYELKLMTDAHHLKDMAKNTLSYKVSQDILIDKDEKTGNTVENRFTGDTAYEEMPIDGSSVDQGGEEGEGIELIHRNNFPELLTEVEENKPWTDKLLNRANGIVAPKSVYTAEMANAWDNATKDYFGNDVPTSKPTWGSTATSHKVMEGGRLTAVGEKLGNPEYWDDPLWDEVLDQVPLGDRDAKGTAIRILTMDTQYKSPGIAAIGLRTNDDGAFQHGEGASQVGNGVMAPSTSCVGYPGSTVLAQTWNQVLAYMFGKSEGNDMGPAGKDALYSPACNIHRSPYGGRNSGYQSEDPYLSGRVVGNIIKGLGVYGRTSFMKHFVVNDQDFNRMGLYTWLSEQALREIYLRTFEEGVKYGDSTGIMTSFNRLGGIWAGGNEALMTGILRNEWGFKGAIITDMTENEENMDSAANLRTGGNINLGGDDSPVVALSASSTARVQHRMRQAIKEYVYAYCHALYKNLTYNASADPSEAVVVAETKQSWQWWKPAIVAADAIVYGAIAIGVFLIAKPFLPFGKAKDEKEAE